MIQRTETSDLRRGSVRHLWIVGKLKKINGAWSSGSTHSDPSSSHTACVLLRMFLWLNFGVCDPSLKPQPHPLRALFAFWKYIVPHRLFSLYIPDAERCNFCDCSHRKKKTTEELSMRMDWVDMPFWDSAWFWTFNRNSFVGFPLSLL